MKYHGHTLTKVMDNDIEGGSYYIIYKNNNKITCAWTLSNAKEFVDSYDGHKYCWEVLA